MKTLNVTTQKRDYNPPQIERIELDNEISLILSSDPPTFEKLSESKMPEYYNNNPFNSKIG